MNTMFKPISKNVHGVIDYAYAAVVPFLPELAGFSQNVPARLVCRSLGAGALSYSLLTKAKWGLYKLLPFRKHLILDIAVSVVAVGTPWLLGFSKNAVARNIVLGVGLSGITAAILTDPVQEDDQLDRYLFI